jgi:hypothetical protein
MKSLTLLLVSFILLPFSAVADELDDQINKACLRHAVSLVSQLKTDVVGELSQDKSDQALKLATDSCQAYFKKEFSQDSEAVAVASNNKKEAENDDDGDWFTEKILSGEVTRKKGNERLRNLKR